MSKKEFTYTLRIDAEINDLVAKTAKVRQSMQQVMDSGKAPGAEKIFTSIEHAIDRLRQKASTPITSAAAFSSLQRDTAAVSAQLVKLGGVIENLGDLSEAEKIDLLPADFKQRVKDAQAAVAAFATAYSAATTETKEMVEAQRDLAKAEREQKKAEGKVSEKTALIDATKAEITEIEKKKKALEKFLETQAAYEKAGANKSYSGDKTGKQELQGKSLPADRAAAKAVDPNLDLKDTEAVQARIQSLTTEIERAEQAQRRYETSLSEWEKKAQVAGQSVSDLEGKVDALNAEFEQNKAKDTQAAYAKLRTEAGKLGVDLTNIPLDYTEQNLKELTDALIAVKQQGLDQVHQGFDTFQTELNETAASCDKTKDSIAANKDTFEQLDERARNTQAFAQRVKAFVGIEGAANLARRAFQNAFSTIKELDKAMTEMAVVTELDVGDYWKQLPDYTDRANELGVSIKSAYESATLFYQQGLKTNEVVAMSNETLKMARIAGLSAEDATNKMTAALRGFNMELNETSAQRVADVYSELAAITASDVNEISSAMTKTASIAASAGMEFETTAAFLSQIIETTRESAETAGTALKTVIARFQELKKDPAEIGEVDGEIVDANKIETALRSVGVTLRDSSGQFRELDDVFLELSSKWDGLDTNTQRYIATIAAGSRQQSRFIAMMSDYGRTQELVSAANTSAGASNKQFEKTMDSLESKLNQLKNSWDTFTMSLMNNELIKAGIDILTGLMNTINDVIAAFDKIGLGGAASLGMVIGALALGAKAVNSFEMSLRAVDKDGNKLYTTLGAIGQAGKKTFTDIKKSITGIPASLDSLRKKLLDLNGVSKLSKTDEAKKAKEDYIAAINHEKMAQNRLNSAIQDYGERSIEAQKAENEFLGAQHSRIVTQNALYAAMELTEGQQREANLLTLQDVSAEKAAILAKMGYSAASIQKAAASKGETAAELSNILVERLANKTTLQGVVAKGLSFVAQKLETKGKLGATIANYLYAASAWVASLATWQLVLVILAFVAAIAVLVLAIIGIVAAFKKAQANSPEGKLKAAEEAAEAAADAANQAKEAYDGLADSFDNLADKYDALDELTQGTREWRDAVKEINGEVMDLIDKYPELAGLVTSEDGVLKLDIESDEVQAVLDKYEAQSIKANSAELAAKIGVNNAQTAVDYKNLSDSAELGNQAGLGWARAGAWTSGIASMLVGGPAGIAGMVGTNAIFDSIQQQEEQNKANTEKMAEALAKGLVMQDEDGSWQVTAGSEEQLKVIGLSIEEANRFAAELGDGAEELREYGQQVQLRKEQEKAMYDAMATNAQQLVDTSKMSKEAQNMISSVANADYMASFKEQAAQDIAKETEGLKNGALKDWTQKQAEQMYGTDQKIIAYDDGSVVIGEGEEAIRYSKEQFQEQLTAARATEDAAEAMGKIPQAINNAAAKLGGEAGKALKNAFKGKDGSELTKEDLDQLKQERYLQKAWEALGAEGQKAFASEDDFYAQMNDTVIATAEMAYAQAVDLSTKAGIEVMSGVGVEAARGYAEKMRDVFLASGEKTAQDMDEKLRTLTDGLNQADKTKFFSALNAVDWSDLDKLESLPDMLKELNVSLDPTALNDYIAALGQANGAIRNIDVNKLKESAQTLTKLSKDITSGEQGRSFSKENYEALVAMNADLAKDFVLGLDGEYKYIGSAMSDLTDAIRDNTTAMLQDTMELLDNKIATAEIMDQMKINFSGQTYNFSEIAGKEFTNENVQREMLKQLQQNAIASGVSITGISGFNENMDVDKLERDELRAVLDALMAQQNAKKDNENLRQEAAVDTGTTIYQKNTSAQNAYGALKSAGARYEKMTQEQKNEFEMRSDALGSQAIMAGIDEKTISNYTKILNLYKKSEASLEQMNKATADLANATSYKQMRDGLQGVFEEISSINEEYEKIADGDVAAKLALVNKALADFGIEVDNEADADKYMELLNQLSQGNIQAMIALAETAKGEGEVTAAFFDQMVEAHLGYWKMLENGAREFVWATIEELQTTAEVAGTAVEMWENPYTWLYNQNEQLNRLSRERERIEREYTRALEDESNTAEDLLAISQKQLANLKEQSQFQAISAARALDDIKAQFDANSQFANYVRYDATTGAISVDYDGLDAAGFDADKGSEFEEFLSAIEENRDIILDAEETLEDIEDQVKEVKNRGKEETSDLYDRIKEGLVQSRQNEIDKLSDINESIQEAQASLVDQMQKQIDEARQARDNEKTEQEITDKEARLAYLMRDTSGGNAMEIASLQKEIAEAQESYTDSLVDQSLAELQDANAKAAKQRQHQIDIAQAQLDAYANSAEIWTEVQSILETSQAENRPFLETQAAQLIAIAEGRTTMNPIEKKNWEDELANTAVLSKHYTSGQAKQEAEALQNEITNLKDGVFSLLRNAGDDGTFGNKSIANGLSSIATGDGASLKSIIEKINDQKIIVTVNTNNGDTGEPKPDSTLPGSGQTTGEGGETIDEKPQDKEVTVQNSKRWESFQDARQAGYNNILKPADFIKTSAADKYGSYANYLSKMQDYFEYKTGEDYVANELPQGTKVYSLSQKAKDQEKLNFGYKVKGSGDSWLELDFDETSGFTNNAEGHWLDRVVFEKAHQRRYGNETYKSLANALFGKASDNEGGFYNLKGTLVFAKNGDWWIPAEEAHIQYEEQRRETEAFLKYIQGLKNNSPAFKTGGLADFTGPAWLDGTKSKPEIVLNQQDSANFLILRDILSDILNGTTNLSKTDKKDNGGDNYYDIEINVESLGDDYDVEQLADKIRSMIYDDATYRNVNSVNKR